MPLSADIFWSLLLMLVLLGFSAFFSGSETAFFNLSKRQREQFLNSKKKSHQLTAALLTRPKKLLTTLLLGNMAVNVLYFSLASSLSVKFSVQSGGYTAAFCAVASFVVLVLFGEMLPKSIAYANSLTLSIFSALPAFICVYFFAPIRLILNWIFVVPALRLLSPSAAQKNPITAQQFNLLIDSNRQRGLITEDENQFLSAVVELGVLKARHIMRPRVDMVFCRAKTPSSKAVELLKKRKRLMIFVYTGKIDNVIGVVSMRKLVLNTDSQVKDIMEEVQFVPEQKRVDVLLDTFLKNTFDSAVVVDEFGQIAGAVSLDDIIDHILGKDTDQEDIEPVEQVGPMEYRLAGDLSIHHWAQEFGLDHANVRFSTVAGLTAALLGRVPKPGDTVYLRNLKFTVEKVQRHRIKSIILTFEPLKNNNGNNN
ncbi:MAG: HlyC/CorC family transporter [Sedimentisphaerales bacterium]|nr:HlyC/CorC family transporter [Sedimentisphaerales bacterium]